MVSLTELVKTRGHLCVYGQIHPCLPAEPVRFDQKVIRKQKNLIQMVSLTELVKTRGHYVFMVRYTPAYQQSLCVFDQKVIRK